MILALPRAAMQAMASKSVTAITTTYPTCFVRVFQFFISETAVPAIIGISMIARNNI